jgi:hypothetical protein
MKSVTGIFDKRSLIFPRNRKSVVGIDGGEVGPGCVGRMKLVTGNLGIDEDGCTVRLVLTLLFLNDEVRKSFAEFRLFVNGTYDSLLSGAPGCEVPESVDLGNILLPHGGGGDVLEVEARNHTSVKKVLNGGLEMALVRLPFIDEATAARLDVVETVRFRSWPGLEEELLPGGRRDRDR